MTADLDDHPVLDQSKLRSVEEDAAFWERRGCFYFTNLCHFQNDWFYKPKPSSSLQKQQQAEHQPANMTFQFNRRFPKYEGYPTIVSIQEQYNHSSSLSSSDMQCTDSSTPLHLIIHGKFNHMMLEYLRATYFGWHEAIAQYPAVAQAQPYLLMYKPDNRIHNGHRMFASIVTNRTLRDARGLFRQPNCTCLPRVAMCGFNRRQKHNNMIFPDNWGYSAKVYDRQIIRHQDVWEALHKAHPKLSGEIIKYKKRILRDRGLDVEQYQDYRFIGLCQRRLRRSWRNLSENMRLCENYLQNKIICVIVDLDDKSLTMLDQAIIHGSMTALVGIHGSQLANIVLMPPNPIILELNPYMRPEQAFGRQWVRNTAYFTNIGVYLTRRQHMTHIGFPLEKDSVQFLCPPNETDCTHRWDISDFEVNPMILKAFFDRFLLDPPRTCHEWKERRDEAWNIGGTTARQFVVYNAPCRDYEDESSVLKTCHYFTNHTLIEIHGNSAPLKFFGRGPDYCDKPLR